MTEVDSKLLVLAKEVTIQPDDQCSCEWMCLREFMIRDINAPWVVRPEPRKVSIYDLLQKADDITIVSALGGMKHTLIPLPFYGPLLHAFDPFRRSIVVYASHMGVIWRLRHDQRGYHDVHAEALGIGQPIETYWKIAVLGGQDE